MRFASDLFHWCNHVCSYIFWPEAHSTLDGVNSVARQQRNRAIKELERTLRQMTRDYYITLLWFQAKCLNFREMWATEIGRLNQDGVTVRKDSFDDGGFYLKCYPCDCCSTTD